MSLTVTVGGPVSASPADCVAPGWIEMVMVPATVALTVNELLVTEGNPVDENVKVYVPAVSSTRLENTARPLLPEVALAVEPEAKTPLLGPLAMVTVTFTPLMGLPDASSTSIVGGPTTADPAVDAPGGVAITSWDADVAEIVIGVLVPCARPEAFASRLYVPAAPMDNPLKVTDPFGAVVRVVVPLRVVDGEVERLTDTPLPGTLLP